MSIDRLMKMILVCLSLLIAAGLGVNLFSTRPAGAQGGGDIGRYQIAAWASYSGERVHHNGYYVLDTVTGKVVDKGHSVHGIGGAGPPD